jgi:hypothetical protein
MIRVGTIPWNLLAAEALTLNDRPVVVSGRRASKRDGFHLVFWQAQGLGHVLVSDVSTDELLRLVATTRTTTGRGCGTCIRARTGRLTCRASVCPGHSRRKRSCSIACCATSTRRTTCWGSGRAGTRTCSGRWRTELPWFTRRLPFGRTTGCERDEHNHQHPNEHALTHRLLLVRGTCSTATRISVVQRECVVMRLSRVGMFTVVNQTASAFDVPQNPVPKRGRSDEYDPCSRRTLERCASMPSTLERSRSWGSDHSERFKVRASSPFRPRR